MKRSLKGKLILSYLVVAFITVVVVSALTWLTSDQSLMNLVVEQQTAMLSDSVKTYYTVNGTMDGFFDTYIRSNRSDPNAPQPAGPDKPPKDRNIRGVFGLVDSEYRALMPTFGYDIGAAVPIDRIKRPIAVNLDGKTIAWILPDTALQFKLSTEEELFLQRTTLATAIAALAGVVIAVGMGFFLAGRLIKPIRRLTQASQALARGELHQQLPVTSQDELGQLTTTFNQMSTDLAHADEQRKRLTADITHDLSTPLQVISGYMEMLEEKEVTLSPQRIEIIKTEIDHLRRLVGDLSTLSQAEANGLDIQLQPVQPLAILERAYHSYQPIALRQGIALVLEVPNSSPSILADEGRMQQVLKNLIENALRYTPNGGTITLSSVSGEKVQMQVVDTGSGIEPEDLPYVFDRFYQADKARNSNQGKMGLGLAICKALITAQGGTITANSAGRGTGTSIIMTFDAINEQTK